MPPPPPPPDSFPPRPPSYQPYPADAAMPMKQGNSGMAIASLVCSLVGIVPCFWLFQVMGLLGTIFGFVGLKQTKDGARGGHGLALAVTIIGILLLVLCAAIWIYLSTANCVRSGSSISCTRN